MVYTDNYTAYCHNNNISIFEKLFLFKSFVYGISKYDINMFLQIIQLF